VAPLAGPLAATFGFRGHPPHGRPSAPRSKSRWLRAPATTKNPAISKDGGVFCGTPREINGKALQIRCLPTTEFGMANLENARESAAGAVDPSFAGR